jgi:nucleotide-binding universal stress UspA family protein
MRRFEPPENYVSVITKILVPTDFSEHAKHAATSAGELAKGLGATVHLLHVLHLPVQAVTPETSVVPVGFWKDIRAHAEREIEVERKKLEAAGIEVTSEVFEDVPGFAISGAAERVHADLIVMGSRGLSGLKHAILGSVAERTVRTAPCPVLTVKAEDGPLRLRTIVVGMDFSAAAKRALEIAKLLAQKVGPAHLVLVHAEYVPIELEQYLIRDGDSVLQRMSESVKRDLEKVLVGLQNDGVSAEFLSQRGTPEKLIVEIAEQKKADLIAVGTHGRRGLTHLLLGSVAERVVRTAKSPVLTVRQKD